MWTTQISQSICAGKILISYYFGYTSESLYGIKVILLYIRKYKKIQYWVETIPEFQTLELISIIHCPWLQLSMSGTIFVNHAQTKCTSLIMVEHRNQFPFWQINEQKHIIDGKISEIKINFNDYSGSYIQKSALWIFTRLIYFYCWLKPVQGQGHKNK